MEFVELRSSSSSSFKTGSLSFFLDRKLLFKDSSSVEIQLKFFNLGSGV